MVLKVFPVYPGLTVRSKTYIDQILLEMTGILHLLFIPSVVTSQHRLNKESIFQ